METVPANASPHIIGFRRVMNTQEIRKNLNTHGDAACPVDGQPPIERRDFSDIPELVRTGQFRELGRIGSRKPQRIEYRGTVSGKSHVYIETVGMDRRRVAMPSFYRKD